MDLVVLVVVGLAIGLPLALAAGIGFCLLVMEGKQRVWAALSLATAAAVTTLLVALLDVGPIRAVIFGSVMGILHLGLVWITATRAEGRETAANDGRGDRNPPSPRDHVRVQSILDHLALPKPRFLCNDAYGSEQLVVRLSNKVGRPASKRQLAALMHLAGPSFATLAPLYATCNGLELHRHGATAGLCVFAIAELAQRNLEWRAWFADREPSELYEFQRAGFAFATVEGSGNYFVAHAGRIHYSDHDGDDDAVWGEGVEDFFRRALSDPARFLREAGCYTRYSDRRTDTQFLPKRFLHD